MKPSANASALFNDRARQLSQWSADTGEYLADMREVARDQGRQVAEARQRAAQRWSSRQLELSRQWLNPWHVARDAIEYSVDAGQRQLLFWDALRQRGNNYNAHEQAGCPPLLAYDYTMIVDGRELDRPVNYALVQIEPPEGTQIDDSARPFVIVDPRAGHGAGIGGFKGDSQVGVALRAGHPVYFVIFFQHPEEGQTLADVCEAEAGFVETVAERHPSAARPTVIGNCQGGWAVMLLSASRPGLTGPVVLNGAPLSYWAGKRGRNPMRYMGGLFGGAMPALALADLGNGKFDGANLVSNFENLNPANSLWSKYYKLYSAVDTEADRFLEFERWWGGFYFMNEAEMRWIVENLFVGNLLTAGEARLSDSHSLDLKHITAPIMVFASHGDNITPPEQALNWIPENYRDEHEIKALGQRLVYMVHESIGHLGIFASGELALREHAAMMSTMDAMESLPPGLYEMQVEDRPEGEGEQRHKVSFVERSMDDLVEHIAVDEADDSFGPVSRLSSLSTELYDIFWRPWVQASVTPQSAEWFHRLHPLRVQREWFSDLNPWLAGLSGMASMARERRRPAAEDNLFRQLEQNNARAIHELLDGYRQSRDAGYELAFHLVYGLPAVRALAKRLKAHDVERDHAVERHLPEVQAVLDRLDEGGLAAAVVRLVVMVGHARGGVHRAVLKRFSELMKAEAAFADLDPLMRSRLIYEQTLISELEPHRARSGLRKLLPKAADRKRAVALVERVLGDMPDRSSSLREAWAGLRAKLVN